MIPWVDFSFDDEERVIVLPGKSASRVLAQIQLHVFSCFNSLLLIKWNAAGKSGREESLTLPGNSHIFPTQQRKQQFWGFSDLKGSKPQLSLFLFSYKEFLSTICYVRPSERIKF